MNSVKLKKTILTVFLLFLIIAPLIVLIGRSIFQDSTFDLHRIISVLGEAGNVSMIGNSLLLGILVSIVATIIAVPMAFLLAKTKIGNHSWLDVLMTVTFMTPPYIAAMGWILFMQKNGLFQQLCPWSGHISESFFSLWGLVLVMALHSFPFLTSILKNAMLQMNNNLDESAKICGAGGWTRFRKITMPLLKGNYAIGVLMVFVKTLSEYGTPATLGKRIGYEVFTSKIHSYASISPVDFGSAAVLSSLLIGICMVLWMIQNQVTARHTYKLVGGRSAKSVHLTDGRRIRILGIIYIVIILFISIGIPYFSVAATSVIKLRGYGLSAGNFTCNHYIELFSDTSALNALLTSVLLGIASATAASILGVFIVLMTRKDIKWGNIIKGIGTLPEMVPNIVFVIGFMLLYNQIYHWLPVYNTISFMILVYTAMFLPYSVQYTSSAVMQISESIPEAAQVCGANKEMIIGKIMLPLIFRGIMSGWMMIFIIVFRELVGASLISPPNVKTVSTYIVSEFEQGSVSVGMAMAVICILFSLLFLLIINHLKERKVR